MPRTKVLEKHVHPQHKRLVIDLRNNSPYFQARTFLDGRLRQKTTETDDLQTAFRRAESWYRRECRAFHARHHPHPPSHVNDPVMEELFQWYKAELSEGRREYALMRWGPIAEFWGPLPVSTVSRDTFKSFYKWRRVSRQVNGRKLDVPKNHTIHKDRVLVSQILKYAVNEKILEDSPSIPPVGDKPNNPRPWLTHDEFNTLVRVAVKRVAKSQNVRVRESRQAVLDLVLFLYASMGRVGEIRSLRVRDCRLHRAVPAERLLECDVTGKTKSRTLIARQPARKIFDRRSKDLEAADLLFPRHCRDGFRELLLDAKLRVDSHGFSRNLKSIRATSISHYILENPNSNFLFVARNAGTSVAMIDKFYVQRLTAQMLSSHLAGSSSPIRPRGAHERLRQLLVKIAENAESDTRFAWEKASDSQDSDE